MQGNCCKPLSGPNKEHAKQVKQAKLYRPASLIVQKCCRAATLGCGMPLCMIASMQPPTALLTAAAAANNFLPLMARACAVMLAQLATAWYSVCYSARAATQCCAPLP
jgi:hypothetical protein